MSPRADVRAPARLADLHARLGAWVAERPDAAAALARAAGAPLPRDPDAAARAEASLVDACLAHAPGFDVGRPSLAAAVRTTLAVLARVHPGQLVEVRVPPFGAVQVGVPGVASAHTRGTPPNVVETDAATWLALASGRLSWADAVRERRVSASGAHADLTGQLEAVTPAR